MADDQLPSLLPQRWPAVRTILEDLDRALNHLANGPGNTIVTLWSQLRLEFWRAAFLISVSDAYQQSNAAAVAPTADIRDWPAFVRARIPDRRLQATIFSVFYDDYDEVKANANLLQRFTKAAQDLGCSAYDMFLDFGPAIAKSTHALQKISRAFYYNPGSLTRASIVRALQAETLARPDLRPDQPPTPTTRELTRALNKLLPQIASRASSVASSSVGSSMFHSAPQSRANSVVSPGPGPGPASAAAAAAAAASPAHCLTFPRPASKRAAEVIASTASNSMGPPLPKKRKTTAAAAAANEKADEEDEYNDNDDEAEDSRRASGRSSFSASFMRESSSSVVQTPMSNRGVGVSLGPSGGDDDDEEEEDDAAEYVALCCRLLAVRGGGAPKVKDPELRGALRAVLASADILVSLGQQQQQQ